MKPSSSLTPTRHIKRVAVAVMGGTVLLVGVAGIVLPFLPALVLIPAGFGILATEFVWAKRWLKKARDMARARQSKGTAKHGD
jgi:uncharacterized membrane protein YbaN (DUF454 family)